MENLAQLVKRRGDVASSTGSGPRLYKRVAEQIASADAGTRNAALDCMAYLYKHSGENMMVFVADLKPKERDLLRNRIDKMSMAPAARTLLAGTPARGSPLRGSPAPSPSRLPARRSIPSSTSSPESSHSSRAASALSGSAKFANLPSEQSDPILHRPKTSLPHISQASISVPTGLGRSKAAAGDMYADDDPVDSHRTSQTEKVADTINAVTKPDPADSVEALKRLQWFMENSPEQLANQAEPIISVITNQLRKILSRANGLRDPQYFRLLKHLVQALSMFCDDLHLVVSMSSHSMRTLLDQLTLALMATDTVPTHEIKEMSKYLNLMILRFFNTGKRATVLE